MTLTTAHVSVTLAGRPILADVSCSFGPRDVVAVVGANGAGKSTLLKALAGLIRPSAGSVKLDGQDLATLPASSIAHRIAYLPQAREVHWPISVAQTVALGRLPYRTGWHAESAADRSAVDEAIRAMDLQRLINRSTAELSGGELARVLLARALAQEAGILIADEPTAGLDLAHVLDLFGNLRRLAHQGRTVIVALHDLSLALRFCNRAVLLANGRILAAGTTPEVLTPDSIRQAFGVQAEVVHVNQMPIVLALTSLT